MNQKAGGNRQQRRLEERAEIEEQLGKQRPEEKALWEKVRAELAQTRREARLPIEENLPDVWNYDSQRLLKELDGIREMIVQIPATLETRSALQSAIDRIWRVGQDVRFLLHLHREGQRSFAQRSAGMRVTKATSSGKANEQATQSG